MANSLGQLGFSGPPRPMQTVVPIPGPTTTSTKATASNKASLPSAGKTKTKFAVLKGFLPLVLYSMFACAAPLLTLYGDDITISYTEHKFFTIGLATVGALVFVLANDCIVWFNMTYFFHIGIEVKVLDLAIRYAMADGTATEGVVLAWVAIGTILLHLIPPLVLDHPLLLTLVAFAGVPVNASLLAFVETGDLMLLAIYSSIVFLGAVLLIACAECGATSMLSNMKKACRTGNWLVCSYYLY